MIKLNMLLFFLLLGSVHNFVAMDQATGGSGEVVVVTGDMLLRRKRGHHRRASMVSGVTTKQEKKDGDELSKLMKAMSLTVEPHGKKK